MIPLEQMVDVLVVGAGPTGVTAATMLAQRGIGSLVIDRHADIYPLPRAVHLDDEIYRILQGIGAADAFGEITEPRLGMRVVDSRLRHMAQFDRTREVGDHGWPQANFFDQPELERVLRENLLRFSDVRLTGRMELVSLEQPAEGPASVRTVLRHLDSGEQTVVWARAVLGCDGANSTVRDRIGAHLLDLDFEERWLVIDVRSPTPLDVWNGVDQVSDTRRPGTFMKVVGERYRWEFRLDDDEYVEDLTTPERLSALIEPWTKGIPFDSLEILRKAEYTFRARIADRWSQGRVFLLGDAAHLTPPFIGQGLCAAMRDTSNLIWKLAAVLSGQAPESLLATYGAERPEPAKALIKKAALLGTVMTGGPSATSAVRRVALAALCRIPGISSKILDNPPPPLPLGTIVHSGKGRRLPGSLVPQPWVEMDAKRVRLDDVLGSGFAVLTATAPTRALVELAHNLDARIVLVSPLPVPAMAVPGVDVVVVDCDTVLTPWMSTARADAVLLRPDRIVLAQQHHRGQQLDAVSITTALVSGAVDRAPAAEVA